MKKIILGVSILAFASPAVMAADMAVKAPPAPLPPVYTWTGGYVGVNVGYGWGNENASQTTISGADFPIIGAGTLLYNSPNSFRLHPEGVLGGAQIGYNWQVSPIGVLGVEADFQGSAMRNSNGCILGCGVPLVTTPISPYPYRFPGRFVQRFLPAKD